MSDIMCIDDDRLCLKLYEQVLLSKSHDVRSYLDPEEGLISFRKRPADVVIIDLQMPTMTGFEVCSRIRKEPVGGNVPIIIVSSSEREEDVTRGLTAGADDYLIKPVRAGELTAKVTMCLRKRASAPIAELGVAQGGLFAGQYQIQDKIAEGGFSQVFVAKDVTGKYEGLVCLKVLDLPPAQVRDERYLSIFLREAYAHSKLKHPNIVQLWDFGHVDSRYFLVMEFLSGQTLDVMLREKGTLTERTLLLIAKEVGSALQYLGDQDVVHRDIKINNVMLTKTGEIKILDFGLARHVDENTLSMENNFQGSPPYVSPEYVRGEHLDIRTDIYSLGVTLYVAACGQLPINGPSTMSVLRGHLSQQPRPMAELTDTVSPEFAQLVDRMLAKSREERPYPIDLLTEVKFLLNALPKETGMAPLPPV